MMSRDIIGITEFLYRGRCPVCSSADRTRKIYGQVHCSKATTGNTTPGAWNLSAKLHRLREVPRLMARSLRLTTQYGVGTRRTFRREIDFTSSFQDVVPDPLYADL